MQIAFCPLPTERHYKAPLIPLLKGKVSGAQGLSGNYQGASGNYPLN